MSYLTQSQTNRPAAILGVIVVHAGLAALVVTGLTVAGIIRPPAPPIVGVQLPPAPPPPDPKVEQKKEPAARSVVYAPPQHDDLTKPNFVDTVIVLPPLDGDVIRVDLLPPAVGGVGNSFASVQAAPRSDPARWVTDSDYRSRWIREGLQGTANFRIEIAADGRISACKITRSTGHAALDLATCELITRRARSTPATDSSGTATSGGYTSSIRWQLPD